MPVCRTDIILAVRCCQSEGCAVVCILKCGVPFSLTAWKISGAFPPWLFSIRSFGNLTSNNSIAFIYSSVQVKVSTTASLYSHSSRIQHEGMKTWFKKKGSLAAIGCCMEHPNWYLVPFSECKINLQGSVLSITGPMTRLSPIAHDGALRDPWKSTSSCRSIKVKALRRWLTQNLSSLFYHFSASFTPLYCHWLSQESVPWIFSLPPSVPPFFSAFIFVFI